MKRILSSSTLIFIISLFLLVACGNNEKPKDNNEKPKDIDFYNTIIDSKTEKYELDDGSYFLMTYYFNGSDNLENSLVKYEEYEFSTREGELVESTISVFTYDKSGSVIKMIVTDKIGDMPEKTTITEELDLIKIFIKGLLDTRSQYIKIK